MQFWLWGQWSRYYRFIVILDILGKQKKDLPWKFNSEINLISNCHCVPRHLSYKRKSVTRNFAIENEYWIKSITLGESIYQGWVVMETQSMSKPMDHNFLLIGVHSFLSSISNCKWNKYILINPLYNCCVWSQKYGSKDVDTYSTST